MYTYEIINNTQYRVAGDNYNSIFKGNEADAIDNVNTLNIGVLNSSKTEKIEQLKDYINGKKAAFSAPYSAISIASFVDKRNEAMAYSADNMAHTPYIDMLSLDANGAVNSTLKSELITRILGKVLAVGQLEAFEDSTRAAIKACITPAELDAIVIPDSTNGVFKRII